MCVPHDRAETKNATLNNARAQGLAPSCLARSCDSLLSKLLGSFQVDGVDDFQRRNRHQTGRLVRQGANVHLNFQQLLEKVVVAVLGEVEVG